MSEELKPCPFCGAAEIGVFHHPDRGGVIGESWHVECKAEHCGNGTCHHEIRAEAIAAWNTRADSERITRAADLIERLKGYARHERGCDAVSTLTAPGSDCSCGLTALIKEIEGE